MERHRLFSILHFPSSVLVLVLLAGCAGPSKANIELRKQNQTLQSHIDQLNRQHLADEATIQSLQSHQGSLPTLPQQRLDQFFTVHGLELDRLTGGDDWDASKPGDDGLKVYAVPTDDDGEKIKAAGSFVVEAFDLNLPKDQRVGRWTFDPAESRKNWVGHFMLYEYVLTCPWQTAPTHPDLTIKVSFTDLLTGRTFTAQKQVTVKLPSAPSPSRGTGPG